MKRLLLISILFSIAGIVLFYFHAPYYTIIILFALLLCLPFFLPLDNPSQIITLVIIFLWTMFRMSQLVGGQLLPFYDEERHYEALVLDEPLMQKDRGTCTLQLIRGEGRPLKGKIILQSYDVPKESDIQPGTLLSFKGTLRELSPKRNPGGFNEKLYYRSKGIVGRMVLSAKEVDSIGQQDRFAFKLLGIRRTLVDRLETLSDNRKVTGLISTLLLGEKSPDTHIEEHFRNLGISHILAISGMHVGFLSLALLKFFKILKIPEKNARLLTVPFLFIYALLVALPVQLKRAVLMLSIYHCGVAFRQVKDAFSALLATAIIVLMVNPMQLFSLSFQLSFMATLGIIFFYQPLRYRIGRHLRRTSYVVESLLLTLSAYATTFPIVLFYFHRLNLLSFLGNIVVVPLIGILFIYIMILLPIGFISSIVGALLFRLAEFLGQFILWIAEMLGAVSGFSYKSAGAPIVLALFLLTLVFFGAGYWRPKKKVSIALLTALVLISFVDYRTLPLTERALKIYFLDVGQGDATLIRTPKGYTYLIDGGGYPQKTLAFKQIQPQPISESVLIPALYATGAHRVDSALITHNHEDHSQGVEELLLSFPVQRVYLSTKNNHPSLQQMELIEVHTLAAGQSIRTPDGLTIDCIWPMLPVEALGDNQQNHYSMVLRLRYGNHTLMMMSDTDVQTEAALMGVLGETDILRVGHHGSKTSTGEEMLQHCDPKIAVISVGRGNLYRLPNPEILQRLKTAGVQTYRTDENGCILIEMYNDHYHVRPYIQ